MTHFKKVVKFWSKNTQGVSSSTALARCNDLLNLLKIAGGLVPFAGGPVKAVGELACNLIEVVQQIQTTTEGCARLVERASQLVLSVIEEATQVVPLTPRMMERVERLSRLLSDILDFMRSRLSSQANSKWYRNFWERDSLQADLEHHTARYEEAIEAFNITTLIDIHHTVANLPALVHDHAAKARLITGRDIHDPTSRDVFGSVSSDQCEKLNVMGRTDFVLTDIIQVSQRPDQPSLHHAQYFAPRDRTMSVIVKIYPPRTNYKKNADLHRLIPILHSHTHSLIGQSPIAEPSPYLVISDYTNQTARAFMETQLSVNAVDGFMIALSTLAGIASALQYLRSDIKLGKAELEDCVKVSSIYITPTRKVVVGRDLFTTTHDEYDVAAVSGDLSEWLKGEFWDMTMALLYGGTAAIDWTQWQSIQTNTPHIRPLLTLTSYHCPTFAMMSERLTQLSKLLKPTHSTGDLTYSVIRKEMLKLPHTNPNYFFEPKEPIDVAFGDIGYMKDDVFVKLDNMRDAFTDDEGEANKDYDDYLRASGPIISEDLSDGVIRHSFEDAVYIEFARWKHPEFLGRVHGYWPLFIDKARELQRSCGGKHHFSATDLLFVTGIGHDYRYGHYIFDLKKAVNPIIPPVQLIEYTNAGLNEKWAEWIVDEGRDEIVSTFQRHAQYIDFIQLEDGDVPELGDRRNEAEWNRTTEESNITPAVTSLRPSSGCYSLPAEAGSENKASHTLFPPKNLSLFGIQGSADCASVPRYEELQAEQGSS